MRELVRVDLDWVPTAPDTSLYIRPFLIATDPFLGVRASEMYTFLIILSPVGAYYPEGMAPIKIYIESEDVRAVRGGLGYAKTGANYAATIRAQDRAKHKGFSQVLWLDALERKYIEEVGTSNAFLKIGGEIVTPPLEGTILPGITRMSCLELLRSWGLPVVERRVSIDELAQAAQDGTLEEAFATGTAAVVSPVGTFHLDGRDIQVADGGIGPLTQRLYDTLTDIQWGRADDPFGWTVLV
jgi:branched-chain amino acid aminotransferase